MSYGRFENPREVESHEKDPEFHAEKTVCSTGKDYSPVVMTAAQQIIKPSPRWLWFDRTVRPGLCIGQWCRFWEESVWVSRTVPQRPTAGNWIHVQRGSTADLRHGAGTVLIGQATHCLFFYHISLITWSFDWLFNSWKKFYKTRNFFWKNKKYRKNQSINQSIKGLMEIFFLSTRFSRG